MGGMTLKLRDPTQCLKPTESSACDMSITIVIMKLPRASFKISPRAASTLLIPEIRYWFFFTKRLANKGNNFINPFNFITNAK